MPNIHFFGNSASFAISVMGISLYINTGSMERDSTAAFIKSSSLSIIWRSPVYVHLAGSWKGTVGTFSSSKWMERMYSFRSNSSSFVRKRETVFSRGGWLPSSHSCTRRQYAARSVSSPAGQPSSSAATCRCCSVSISRDR